MSAEGQNQIPVIMQDREDLETTLEAKEDSRLLLTSQCRRSEKPEAETEIMMSTDQLRKFRPGNA